MLNGFFVSVIENNLFIADARSVGEVNVSEISECSCLIDNDKANINKCAH